jgi:hypothetical protein
MRLTLTAILPAHRRRRQFQPLWRSITGIAF